MMMMVRGRKREREVLGYRKTLLKALSTGSGSGGDGLRLNEDKGRGKGWMKTRGGARRQEMHTDRRTTRTTNKRHSNARFP
jgi:hypothetical protein